MRSFDWSATPLGLVRDWPQSLQTSVSICLNSRTPMVIWWSQDLFVLYNDSWGKILGSHYSCALARPGREVWPKIEDIFGKQLASVLATGQAIWSDDMLLVNRGNTEEAYFTYSHSPIFLETGQVGGMFTAMTETTQCVLGERRIETLRLEAEARCQQTENALQESQQFIQKIANTTPEVLYLYDLVEQKTTYINDRTSTLLGYTPEQVQEMGSEFAPRIMHPEDLAQFPAHLERLNTLEDGEMLAFEYRMRHIDGEWRWFGSQDVVFSRTEEGNPCQILGAALDITERKAAEKEREHLLAREQAARAEAERANRVKDEFLAVLSHELRTPLNPILGWTKLLRAGKVAPNKIEQALLTIERNAQLQIQLIEDLLDVSRILQGKLSLDVAPINLEATIAAAIETVKLAAQAKSIQLSMVLEPNTGIVLGDSGRLQQVFWNLLSNAVKFTSEKGRVEVQLKQIGSRVQIQVIDNGKGISPDFLPYVFDYFRQADSATTRKFGGLGLGLAIVRQIVELHGGTVMAASSGEGEGAIFTVMLPLAATNSEARLNNNRNLSSDLEGLRVLVVDDDDDSRDFIAFVVEQAGANVTVAGSAIDALQTLTQSKFDVLVSDIGMPDMNGYMLMRQVKAMQLDEFPAIALTAYASEYDRQQALSAGFGQHLAKPVEPDLLVSAIATLIKKMPN